MAAVAEATDVTVTDLVNLIGDQTVALDDVAGQIPQLVMAKAWAGGLIEFGRAKHVVTGQPGMPLSKPTLRIETGDEWTGPKKPWHRQYSDLKSDEQIPDGVDRYQKYEKKTDPDGVPYLVPVDITEGEAAAALKFRVRLTDKGLSAA
jgi:hypothetical protein